LQADTWYHAAVTYDGNSVMLYLNGVLETSKLTTSLNTMLDKNGLTFGRRPGVRLGTASSMKSRLRRALSQGEIQAFTRQARWASAGQHSSSRQWPHGKSTVTQAPSTSHSRRSASEV
jgi:hypothetical protein